MAKFSGSEALGAGFRIIGRSPGAVVVWGLVYVLLTLAPQAYGYWHNWPQMSAMLHGLSDRMHGADADATMQQMMALRMRMLPYQMLQFPFALLALGLIYGAIYRAVLEPKANAFAYLRFGGQELWLILVAIAAVVLSILIMIPLMLCAVLGGGAIVHALPEAQRWIAVLALVLVTAGLILWLGARFALGLPMSFAERGFKLLDSWRLTRNKGWKIVGVMLGLILIVIVLEILIGGVFMGVVLAAVGANWTTLADTISRAPEAWVAQMTPWFVGLLLLYIPLTGALHAIFIAPFADIYRQLTAKPPGPAMFGEP